MNGEQRSKFPRLFEIDRDLDRLIREIDLLHYLNPLNIEQEKRRFFASKFTEDPVFRYRKVKFNPFWLQRKFFSQPLEDIEDPDIRRLYHDTIYEYSGLVNCISSVGEEKKFFYNSLRVFGAPKEKDVRNAQFILHFHKEEDAEDLVPRYRADEAESFFQAFGQQYNLKFRIRQTNSITGGAMALNAAKTLMVKKNAKFSDHDLRILAHHELGVHMLTTFNAMIQPLRIFSNGLVANNQTQMGLAVLSEYLSDSLSLQRLKELAYRVIASDSLVKGSSFSDTFDLLYSQYKLDRESAWYISLRAHRGGGLTNDYHYLSGLKKIYDYHTSSGDMDLLLSGKVGLDEVPLLKKMKELGLLVKNEYHTPVFQANHNSKDKMEFVLRNLK